MASLSLSFPLYIIFYKEYYAKQKKILEWSVVWYLIWLVAVSIATSSHHLRVRLETALLAINEAPCRKFFCKILKIGRVIASFVCLTKIQRQVIKNQENFQTMPKYHESSKTEYSDSISFINRLTPLIFFGGFWNFLEGLKGGFTQKKSPFFCFCLTTID